MLAFKISGLIALAASLPATVLAGLENCKHSSALNNDNFESKIQGKNALVAFYAPWCGHCKNLAPAWDKVALDFEAEEDCLVVHVDADAAENKALGKRFGVTGYPTLKFFSKDGSAPTPYSGGRSEEALLTFLNEKCGTSRLPGGRLGATAGRMPGLDAIASLFATSPAEEKTSLIDQAKKVVVDTFGSGSNGNFSSEFYVKVLTKTSDASQSVSDYVEKELKRLGKIASNKKALAGKKLDELEIKQNILKSFQKVEQVLGHNKEEL